MADTAAPAVAAALAVVLVGREQEEGTGPAAVATREETWLEDVARKEAAVEDDVVAGDDAVVMCWVREHGEGETDGEMLYGDEEDDDEEEVWVPMIVFAGSGGDNDTAAAEVKDDTQPAETSLAVEDSVLVKLLKL